ncbi:ABC transporter substrate-binding protein [Eoetvoesiella caeni]|uniref:Amino acid/amide ABC transporter substrate-binding protein (HAAT family) n=1 Tax=Eoetvoesiella caeni TaxID=645616 RepID=A0A366HKB2_9BURK|nr:ABC transporter substrate-binding protein [Eoetvoesiella caeni]MCI2807224.1 ABC transporter substrate-binding protein [Eoetvoesiella caeni]NYT53379.1 ABC transporter substrate-binding protein [Eoetvoesiella caeni]RBP43363.1 amino acid/amide ABC transporter substrate-binding protein (HAAT family) [Eoetvoesiella caeni]
MSFSTKNTKVLRVVRSALAVGLLSAGAMAQAADLTIGVILPLSGPIAAQGISTTKGIKAGIEYQDTVKGHKIKMIQLDDASNPSLSTRNAHKLISQDNVDVLIGTGGVPGAMAMATVSRESKTPMVSFTPIGLGGDKAEWVVTTAQSGETMVSAVVDEMKRNGVKSVGYIGFADAWGDVAFAALKKFSAEAGIKVVADERYARADSSVAAQVLKVMAAKPDAVLGGGAGTPGALPYIGLHDRGYKGAIYGTHAILSPEFVKLVGDAGEGLIVPTGPALVGDQLPASNPSKAIIDDYRKAYKAANGEEPYDVFSAYAFDAWLVVTKAAERVPADIQPGTEAYRLALRDAIKTTKALPATEGVFTYSPASSFGDAKDSVVIVKLQKGKWLLQH